MRIKKGDYVRDRDGVIGEVTGFHRDGDAHVYVKGQGFYFRPLSQLTVESTRLQQMAAIREQIGKLQSQYEQLLREELANVQHGR